MIPLNPERTAFGRHETFPLRFGWLTKGHQAWFDSQDIFDQEDATVRLGVGKNMVSAIRYWMIATQVARSDRQSIQPSEVGRMIFDADGCDPYLEDDATIWLLHWLLASNAADATALFWFFNRFHKPEFTSNELQNALNAFVAEHLSSRVSESTLKHDVALLIRMYQPTVGTKTIPLEESLDSPLAMLDLIHPLPGSKYHESRPDFRDPLPASIFGFAVAQLFDATGQPNLPIERLMRSDGILAAPGSVFRLTEECLIAKLEELIKQHPGLFELRETAGVHQVYRLAQLEPLSLLRRYYHGIH